MKLKEWFDFNEGLFNCDFIVKVMRKGSFKNDDVYLTTVVGETMCKEFFGDLEIVRVSLDNYPSGETIGIKLLLWK